MIEVVIPIRTRSKLNQRIHWAVKARQAKEERSAVVLLLWRQTAILRDIDRRFIVTLTRLSPRELDDDNLRGALKSIRDGVADCLAMDDRDRRIKWEYGQEKYKTYGVRVALRFAEEQENGTRTEQSAVARTTG